MLEKRATMASTIAVTSIFFYRYFAPICQEVSIFVLINTCDGYGTLFANVL